MFTTIDDLYDLKYCLILVPRSGSLNLRRYFPSVIYNPATEQYEPRGAPEYDQTNLKGLRTIACIRNPFTRAYSLYKGIIRCNGFGSRAWDHYNFTKNTSFPTFLKKISKNITKDIHFIQQSVYIPNNTQIIRLESMRVDLLSFNKRNNLNIDLDKIATNTWGTGRYNKETDIVPECYEIIKEIYRDDFTRFGYSTRFKF